MAPSHSTREAKEELELVSGLLSVTWSSASAASRENNSLSGGSASGSTPTFKGTLHEFNSGSQPLQLIRSWFALFINRVSFEEVKIMCRRFLCEFHLTVCFILHCKSHVLSGDAACTWNNEEHDLIRGYKLPSIVLRPDSNVRI